MNAFAGAQAGRVARWQLLAAGLDRSVVDRGLRAGRLVVVHRGVYGLPGTEDLPLAVEAAAVLAGGAGVRLSFHSGSVMWGLRPGVARPVHLSLPCGRRGPVSEPGIVVHRSALFHPADTRIHRGLPVASPAWTLLDVASTLPDADVGRLLDVALWDRRLLTLHDIDDVLARAGHHPGRARLERVARPAQPRQRTESRPQARLLELIELAALPSPRTEVPMLGYRLDLFWPELRLAVEVDTYGTHGSKARFAADRRKSNRLLTERGITVLRFTDEEIDARPLQTIATLTRAIAASDELKSNVVLNQASENVLP